MTAADWLPALATSGLFAGGLWLLLGRIKQSVGRECDARLEALKSRLTASELDIEALQSGALTDLARRQMALDNRRLEAVGQLWSSVVALRPARGISELLAGRTLEQAAERAEQDPKLQPFLGGIGKGLGLKDFDFGGAARAQPFLTPRVWATFSALRAASLHPVVRLRRFKAGLDADRDQDAIRKLLHVALPEQAAALEPFGPAGYPILLDELERKLLEDIQEMLAAEPTPPAAIEG